MNTPFTKNTLDSFISRPGICALDTAGNLDDDVLVLGASGKMGPHLCLMLKRCFEQAGKSNRVIAVSRFSSPDSKRWFKKNGIQTITCDLSDTVQLEKLPDAENLWFMAGVKFGASDKPELLHKMNVEMPGLVTQRFKNSRIAALSTGCVYSFVPVTSAGSTEDGETASESGYAESCRGREKAFCDASEKSGLRTILIRLTYSVEMRYGVLVDIAQKVLHRQPIDISMNRFNCIWQGDALSYIIASINLAKSPADILNITGEEILSIRETAITFGKLFDVNPIFTGVEQDTAWLNNSQKAFDHFGKPSLTSEQMIPWIADWLKNGGETLGKPTKFEVRNGKF